MADSLTRRRLYGEGYTRPEVRESIPSYRDLYQKNSHLLRNEPIKGHDCRPDSMHYDEAGLRWETSIFAHGLRQTYENIHKLYAKTPEDPDTRKKPDKLLMELGVRGEAIGDFNYPRGLTVTEDGDIVVADSLNNRIQIFNSFGVYKTKFGKKGSKVGEFNEPTGVSVLPNGDLVIADSKNTRIQVCRQDGVYKFSFATNHEPYSISCDRDYKIIVGTMRRTVEIFDRKGKPLICFPVSGKQTSIKSPLLLNVTSEKEIVVCEPENNIIKYFDYSGQVVRKIHPESVAEGLAVVPAAVCLTPLSQLIIVDSLNRTVNLYTDNGNLIQLLIGPLDELGSVQTCALGPEGHLIVTEFTVSGPHCIKIFRYRDCPCHMSRPGSSKRRTPIVDLSTSIEIIEEINLIQDDSDG